MLKIYYMMFLLITVSVLTLIIGEYLRITDHEAKQDFINFSENLLSDYEPLIIAKHFPGGNENE